RGSSRLIDVLKTAKHVPGAERAIVKPDREVSRAIELCFTFRGCGATGIKCFAKPVRLRFNLTGTDNPAVLKKRHRYAELRQFKSVSDHQVPEILVALIERHGSKLIDLATHFRESVADG